MRHTNGRARIGAFAKLMMIVSLTCPTLALPAVTATVDKVGKAQRRCGVALLAARTHVNTVDTRTLARCALAVLSDAESDVLEKACWRLRTSHAGIDLVDRRASKRVADWCAVAHPEWLASRCTGPGPWSGSPTQTPLELARCVVSSTHCLARRAVEALLGPLEASVGAENPANLLFEYGEVGGNSFAACDEPPTSACPE